MQLITNAIDVMTAEWGVSSFGVTSFEEERGLKLSYHSEAFSLWIDRSFFDQNSGIEEITEDLYS